EFISVNAGIPVVTWAGKSADLPQLKAAAQRHNLLDAFQMIESRHLDLFQFVKKSVRFPMPGLGLGDVAGYFSIPRRSRISDGQQAQLLYAQYRCSCDEERRTALRASLCEYNRDDVEALIGVVGKISALDSE